MTTIHLQGIGERKAIEAGELTEGAIIVWNYGWKSEVVGITASKTGKTLTVSLRSLQDGVVRSRRMRVSTLVAVA